MLKIKQLKVARLVLVGVFFLGTSVVTPASGSFIEIVNRNLASSGAREKAGYLLWVVRENDGSIERKEEFQAEKEIYPASTIKTAIAFEVLRQVDHARHALGERVAISQSNAAEECRDWGCADYGPGAVHTVRELLWDMIVLSNNIATNQLIDLVGRENVNELAGRLGMAQFRLSRKVYVHQDPEPEIRLRNKLSARDLALLFHEIATGQKALLSNVSRGFLVDCLRHQHSRDRLNAWFPSDVVFYHKTGSTSFSSADSGYFYVGPGKVAILVGLQDFRRIEGLDGFEILRHIGKETLDELRSETGAF